MIFAKPEGFFIDFYISSLNIVVQGVHKLPGYNSLLIQPVQLFQFGYYVIEALLFTNPKLVNQPPQPLHSPLPPLLSSAPPPPLPHSPLLHLNHQHHQHQYHHHPNYYQHHHHLSQHHITTTTTTPSTPNTTLTTTTTTTALFRDYFHVLRNREQ